MAREGFVGTSVSTRASYRVDGSRAVDSSRIRCFTRHKQHFIVIDSRHINVPLENEKESRQSPGTKKTNEAKHKKSRVLAQIGGMPQCNSASSRAI